MTDIWFWAPAQAGQHLTAAIILLSVPFRRICFVDTDNFTNILLVYRGKQICFDVYIHVMIYS